MNLSLCCERINTLGSVVRENFAFKFYICLEMKVLWKVGLDLKTFPPPVSLKPCHPIKSDFFALRFFSQF